MTAICEVCGNTIRGVAAKVQIEGGVFIVCPVCAKLGRPVKAMRINPQPPASKIRLTPPSRPRAGFDEPELVLRVDFKAVIRKARESLKISQEDLGRRMNEKLSVIRHLETGRLKPDNTLARKLEHFLKIHLLIPEEIEE